MSKEKLFMFCVTCGNEKANFDIDVQEAICPEEEIRMIKMPFCPKCFDTTVRSVMKDIKSDICSVHGSDKCI